MSQYLTDGYYREAAAYAPVNERLGFLKRTYGLLLLAVVMLVGLEAVLIKSGVALDILKATRGTALVYIGSIVLLILSSFVANYLARSGAPPAVQFMGLTLEVFIWAWLLLPAMYACSVVEAWASIPFQAGILTLIVFGGLTAAVFISKKDFSFLGSILVVASLVAIGVMICASLMGFSLGLLFIAAMIALGCGYILYDTSNVLHHYPTNAHFAAALALFSSVAYLFLWIVQLMMNFSSND